MIRVLFLLLALAVAVACGDGPTADSQKDSSPSGGNKAPVISSIELVPDSPGVGDVLSVEVRAMDPDGDRVEIEVDWYRNGELEQSGTQTGLVTQDFRSGDRVWAEVWISDGDFELTERTRTIRFANQAPDVLAVRLVPPKPSGSDTLLVEVNVLDRDDDPYELNYRWYVNDTQLPGESGSSLAPGKISRGDKVAAEVSASDASGTGDWVRTPALDVRNSAPIFTSQPSDATVVGGGYRYLLKAEDPDGDRPLRYSLIEGPAGLRVDLVSGAVSWQVPEGEGGGFPIKLAVSDPHGARTEQSYTLNLSWESEPASGDRAEAEDTDSEGARE